MEVDAAAATAPAGSRTRHVAAVATSASWSEQAPASRVGSGRNFYLRDQAQGKTPCPPISRCAYSQPATPRAGKACGDPSVWLLRAARRPHRAGRGTRQEALRRGRRGHRGRRRHPAGVSLILGPLIHERRGGPRSSFTTCLEMASRSLLKVLRAVGASRRATGDGFLARNLSPSRLQANSFLAA